eukprot:3543094-Rhodomonas_salina.1
MQRTRATHTSGAVIVRGAGHTLQRVLAGGVRRVGTVTVPRTAVRWRARGATWAAHTVPPVGADIRGGAGRAFGVTCAV